MMSEPYCNTCFRGEDDGATLVPVTHEDALWCRSCINDFGTYNIQEALQVTRGPMVLPEGATIIRFPATEIAEVE